MWTYKQSTGTMLRPDGAPIATGYSGNGQYKNQPACQVVVDHGPIPQGVYYIGKPIDSRVHGPHAIPLTPSPDNKMFNRSGFLIHGDSVIEPGSASDGCIIMPLFVREAISSSDDLTLSVQA